MNTLCKSAAAAAVVLALSSTGAQATTFGLNTADATNGIYDLYSSTFDGGLIPCSGGSPPQCSFFGGDPPAPRGISIAPSPTGVTNGPVLAVAGGYSGSSLDLTLSGGNTSVTLNGGAVSLPALTLTIAGATTVTTAPGAGWAFVAGGTTAIDGSRHATLQVNASPGLAGDFSTLGGVVTGCAGPLCSLLGVLSLDMVRYQLDLQFDPTFTSFTGKFEGQTANNSLIFANLNSTPVPVPAAGWLMLSGIGALAGLRRKQAKQA